MKTMDEVEKLKNDWERDPCWELCLTEGFEEHAEELREFQRQKEAKWKTEREEKERTIDAKAEELGVIGLYRLILKQQNEIKELKNQIDMHHILNH